MPESAMWPQGAMWGLARFLTRRRTRRYVVPASVIEKSYGGANERRGVGDAGAVR